MLPRLALGIIMVPFTWWFVQWTISLATVVTASVITIPMETVANNTDNSFLDSILIPKKIKITNMDKLEEEATTGNSCDRKVWPVECIPVMDFINKWGGAYGSLLAYAYGVFQINEVAKVNGILDTAKTIWELVNGVIIWVLMFIVFGILVLALIFVLMMRAIKLWMYAIFSPLFTVHFVLGKDMLGEKMWDFNLKEFVWLCFVPAVVWLVLSFGLVIISGVMWAKTTNPSDCDDTKCRITMFGIPDNYIETKIEDAKTNTTVAFGWITMEFIGKAYNTKANWDAPTNWTEVAKNTLTAIGGIFGTIVIDIIALIFIWVAFMAAKWTSKAVGKAIEPFENMGKKVWELWASLPKYTPLPIPGGSVAGMQRTVDLSKQSFESKMREKEEENIGRFAPHLVQWTITEKSLNEAKVKMTNWTETLKASWSVLQWAKDTGINLEKVHWAQKQSGQFEFMKQEIEKDKTYKQDEKLKEAFKKYFDGKIQDMDEYQKKAVADYFRKYWSSANNSTNSSAFVNRAQNADFINITIDGKSVSADIKVNDKIINDSELDKITKWFEWKKSWIKKDDFINGLKQQMRTEIAEKIAGALETKNKDFFTK